MALHQLDTENADRDISSLVTVLTDSPAVSGVLIGLIKLGDGVKDLDGTGGDFSLVITVGGQTVQPSPQTVTFSTAVRGMIWTTPFPIVAGDEVIMRVLSPNAADTDVDCTAYLYDTTYAQPDAIAGAASGIAIVGSEMVVPDTQKVDVNTLKTKALTVGAAVTINASVGAATIVPTNTQFEARSMPTADYVVVGDTIAGVTTVGSVSGAVGSVAGNVDGLVSGTVAGKTPAEAGDAMTLAADSIKKVTYDESTAWPLLSADTGASQVARVGADGDTLETLSDQMDGTATPAQVNEQVLDVLNVDTFAEPGDEAPAATTTLVNKISYCFKFLRNKIETTATKTHVYNDAGANKDQTATISDDGTTFTRGKFGAGE
ncbi:MAG: hypothetical protein GY841_12490 [FCB group bacterium]|nr:hypothetical protein [FCB group bacterium]